MEPKSINYVENDPETVIIPSITVLEARPFFLVSAKRLLETRIIWLFFLGQWVATSVVAAIVATTIGGEAIKVT